MYGVDQLQRPTATIVWNSNGSNAFLWIFPNIQIWYGVSEDLFENVLHLHDWWGTLIKVAIDQSLWGPLWNNTYILLLGLMKMDKLDKIFSGKIFGMYSWSIRIFMFACELKKILFSWRNEKDYYSIDCQRFEAMAIGSPCNLWTYTSWKPVVVGRFNRNYLGHNFGNISRWRRRGWRGTEKHSLKSADILFTVITRQFLMREKCYE